MHNVYQNFVKMIMCPPADKHVAFKNMVLWYSNIV